MSRLGPDLTARLNTTAMAVAKDPIALAGGQLIADSLRKSLPDLDDVTIGRVAGELAGLLGHMTLAMGDRNSLLIVSQIAAVAVNLTALERQSGESL